MIRKRVKLEESATVKLKRCDVSPRKMGIVVKLVQNKSIEYALALLSYSSRAGSLALYKLIKSAMASVKFKKKEGEKLCEKDWFIIESCVGSAGMIRKMKPVSRGVGHTIRRRFSHVVITITRRKQALDRLLNKVKDIKETE